MRIERQPHTLLPSQRASSSSGSGSRMPSSTTIWPFIRAEAPLALGLAHHEARDGLAPPSDDDLLAIFRQGKQARELGLRLMDVDSGHGVAFAGSSPNNRLVAGRVKIPQHILLHGGEDPPLSDER